MRQANHTITPVRVIQATEVSEGAGFTVHRTIGTPALRNLDEMPQQENGLMRGFQLWVNLPGEPVTI